MRCNRCGFSPRVRKSPWRREWQPIPVFLLGKFHGQRSLAGYSSWGRWESDMTEHTFLLSMEKPSQKSSAETRWPEVDEQGGNSVYLVMCLKHRGFFLGIKICAKWTYEIKPECREIQERHLWTKSADAVQWRGHSPSTTHGAGSHTGLKGPKLARYIWAEGYTADIIIPSELKM